jgi:hypothetical protein
MTTSELFVLMMQELPHEKDSHIMWWTMSNMMTRGNTTVFINGLTKALLAIDEASPGYAKDRIERISAIKGLGDTALETLYQIMAEIYCAAGAVAVADRDAAESAIFKDEPRAAAGGKNPEFSSQFHSIKYAVEVKSPSLIQYRKNRATKDVQLTTRIPHSNTIFPDSTLPRDNPVKDFVVSANAKFEEFARVDDGFRILTIVWDGYMNEVVAALTSKVSGLFTDRSFHRGSDGKRFSYPFLDGVVVCDYQLTIAYAFLNKIDLTFPAEFMKYHVQVPPKAFILCPDGRPVPEELLTALGATPLEFCHGTEYQPIEMIQWFDFPR